MRIGLAVLMAIVGVSIAGGAAGQPNPFGDPKVLEAECADDNLESCSKLANYFMTRNTDESKARSIVLTTATCEKGYLPACGDLAASYSLGLGVEQDEQRAYEINIQLCDKEYGPGCASLGFVHALGKAGFEIDEAKALEYFARACDLDDATGCERAGKHWNSLLNPNRDVEKAKAYFGRACNLGNRFACEDLGRLQAD